MKRTQLLVVLALLSACTSKQAHTDDTGDTSDTSDTSDSGDTGESTTQPIDDTLTESLTLFGGCGDIFMYAKNADDTLGLFVFAKELVEAAFASDTESTTFNLDVASADSSLSILVQSGKNITYEACNDALDPDMLPVVHSEYRGVSGNARFTIMPTGEATDWGEMPANATLLLENIALQDTSASKTTAITSWGFDAAVGWLPG